MGFKDSFYMFSIPRHHKETNMPKGNLNITMPVLGVVWNTLYRGKTCDYGSASVEIKGLTEYVSPET